MKPRNAAGLLLTRLLDAHGEALPEEKLGLWGSRDVVFVARDRYDSRDDTSGTKQAE